MRGAGVAVGVAFGTTSSSVIPHFGHSLAFVSRTSGCIGHTYSAGAFVGRGVPAGVAVAFAGVGSGSANGGGVGTPPCPEWSVAPRVGSACRWLRGGSDAKVIAVATEGDGAIERFADEVLWVPGTHEALSPVLAVIPLQLFAYHMAVARGTDVDQPRHLAKSVTVE